MKKKDELAQSSEGCLAKAANDEVIFVLRAQDITAPKVILHWIAKNFEDLSKDRLREAFEVALQMKDHIGRKKPD